MKVTVLGGGELIPGEKNFNDDDCKLITDPPIPPKSWEIPKITQNSPNQVSNSH